MPVARPSGMPRRTNSYLAWIAHLWAQNEPTTSRQIHPSISISVAAVVVVEAVGLQIALLMLAARNHWPAVGAELGWNTAVLGVRGERLHVVRVAGQGIRELGPLLSEQPLAGADGLIWEDLVVSVLGYFDPAADSSAVEVVPAVDLFSLHGGSTVSSTLGSGIKSISVSNTLTGPLPKSTG